MNEVERNFSRVQWNRKLAADGFQIMDFALDDVASRLGSNDFSDKMKKISNQVTLD